MIGRCGGRLKSKMNLWQIICGIKSFGNHSVRIKHGIDIYCLECDKYLHTNYNAKSSRKAMRNSFKMWWETKE